MEDVPSGQATTNKKKTSFHFVLCQYFGFTTVPKATLLNSLAKDGAALIDRDRSKGADFIPGPRVSLP